MHKILPAILFLLNITVGVSQPGIASDRLLVFFKKEVPVADRGTLCKQLGASAVVHIPNPDAVLAYTPDALALKQQLLLRDEVTFVSHYLTDGQGHYAAPLNYLIAKLKDGAFETILKRDLAGRPVVGIEKHPVIGSVYLLYLDKGTNPIELAGELSALSYLQYAVPDYMINPSVSSSDTHYNRQWALENNGTSLQGSGTPDADVDVNDAWAVTTGSDTLKVAIVDSGVDTLHPDLLANILPGYDAVGDSTDGYPTPFFQEDGHGTCCAGIVAAVKDNNLGIAGVAPSCKIVPIRSFYYLDAGTGGIIPFSTGNAFASAITWAWQNAGAHVLSNSWGLPVNLAQFLPGGTTVVNDAIDMAHTQGRGGLGCCLLFSSGNEEDSTGPIWPANREMTVAVNATSMCDERKNANDCSPEDWSGNWGGNLDISAPGVRIATTDMRGTEGYTVSDYTYTFNGTSAACPNAAGVFALVMSLRPELPHYAIADIVKQSCDKVGGYDYSTIKGSGSWSRELGYGRVNAMSAVTLAQTYVLSTQNDQHISDILLFPNPACDKLTISSPSFENESPKVVVTDALGQQIFATTASQPVISINTENWKRGFYLVQTGNRVMKLVLR